MPTVQVNKLWVAAFVDPAGGPRVGQSQSGLSRAAITVIGQDDLERVFILSSWAKRVAPDALMELMFETNTRWRPAVFGIDVTGPQGNYYFMVQKEMRERGLKVPFRESKAKLDKAFSIETTIQPLAAAGRLLRPLEAECRPLMEEWKAFPDGMYRDCLDSLACAIRLLPSVLPEHLRQMSERQLHDYLKRTGMAEDMIQTRIAQHRAS